MFLLYKMATVLNNINNNPVWQKVEKKIQSRRALLESNRKMVSEKSKKDFDSILKREREFSSLLIKAIIPIEIEWDEEAKQNLINSLPFTVKISSIFNDNEEEVIHNDTDDYDKIDKLNLNKIQ